MITLFGLRIQTGEYMVLVEGLIRAGKTSNSTMYCFLNSHMLYEHHKTGVLKEALNAEQTVLLPDGMPVLLSLKWLQGEVSDRIAGNDVMFSLIDKAAEQGLKVFLLGGRPEVLNTISGKLNTRQVQHQTYSPPFAPIEQFDFESQATIINRFNPDIILVGLGCPKQELWMYEMREKVKAPMFGVGGAFALYAGLDTRAPSWMRNLSLEWLYRLSLEPGRLWKRYLVTNSYFIFLFLREFWRVRIRGNQ
ncbi:MAG: WecB/TagA/CpsF family glycosyltransferase [Cyclobacteriaceae bacterium]